MSLFQCGNCGCVENTALSSQGAVHYFGKFFNWDGREELKKKTPLCSACLPPSTIEAYKDKHGKWHGEFERMYLPMGMFKTNGVGNLEHIETGEDDYRKYIIKPTIGGGADA